MRFILFALLIAVTYASSRQKRQFSLSFGAPNQNRPTQNPLNSFLGLFGQPPVTQNPNQPANFLNLGNLFGQPNGNNRPFNPQANGNIGRPPHSPNSPHASFQSHRPHNPRPFNPVDFGAQVLGAFGIGGCQNNGGCQQGCRLRRGRRQCYCFDGYRLNNADGTCSDVDECLEFGPCEGECVNNEGSYICSCPPRTTLQPDGGCFSGGGPGLGNFGFNSCSNENGGCEQGCNDTPQGPQCFCSPGFELSLQDQKSCLDLDECASGVNSCPGACINTIGSYRCDTQLQTCAQQNGGCDHRCSDTGVGAVCSCRNSFELQSDSRSCACPPGFRQMGRRCRAGNGGGRPVLNQNTPGTCENPPNGGCEQNCRVNRRGVKRCACRRNFLLRDDGQSCECPAGFHLNPNGRRCLEGDGGAGPGPAPIVESCEVNNGGCEHNCRINNRGKLVCRCRNGFTVGEDKKSCIPDIPDPCATDNGRCDHICENDNGRPVCSCRPGFQLVNGQICFEATPTTPKPKPKPTANPTSKPNPTPGPTQSGCGTNNKKSLIRRIVGGKPADPKDWPWMAAILRINSDDNFCGGVLITDRHILTAAHCLVDFKKDEIKVRLGEYDFNTKDDNFPTDFTVVDIRLHENYNRSSQENDIAIMKLDRPSSFSEFIWPVCLPPPGNTFEDQRGYVTGWGTTSFGGQVSRVLQEVVIPVWAQPECEAAYPGKITNTMMCAGERAGGKDSCQGDSGGPYLVQVYPSTRWFVIGVVSWGIKCAEAGNPGVYTRVNNYLPWIRSNSIF